MLLLETNRSPVRGVLTHRLTIIKMAGRTGLEPATSDVTGQRSNRLNYRPTAKSLSFVLLFPN